jgi:hypothetical protein
VRGQHDGVRVVQALGIRGAEELLSILSLGERDRAALIGKLSLREDATWIAEVLIELEVDEMARLRLTAALREALDA